jgi:hypothetical protein
MSPLEPVSSKDVGMQSSRALDRRIRGRLVILVMAASFVRHGLYLPPHQGGWPSEKLNKWQKSK